VDIARTPPRRRFRLLALAMALAMAVGIIAMARTLRSAAPRVSRSGLVIATVQRGPFDARCHAASSSLANECSS
jgi:hypothetical protein